MKLSEAKSAYGGSKDKITVIIAAYNRDELFKLCVESLAQQSFKDFELVIADDGSATGIKKIADSFRDRMSIIHIWQDDNGFRKTLAINKAVSVHFPHGKSSYSVANAALLEKALSSSAVVCANGLRQVNEKDIMILK